MEAFESDAAILCLKSRLMNYLDGDMIMSLIPRSSLFDFNDLSDVFQPPVSSKELTSGFFSPRVDITDKGDHYEIAADLPGVEKDKLSVTLEDGVLTIEASTTEESTEEDAGRVIRRERRSGKFMRSFTLGQNIQESDIKANFKDGVLTLEAPKAKQAEAKKMQIDVR